MPFYPFLLALYPIFHFYDQNKRIIGLWKALETIPSVLILAAFVVIVFYFALRDFCKSGIISGIFLIMFFFHETIFFAIENFIPLNGFQVRGKDILWLDGFILILCFLAVKKSKRSFIESGRILNFTCLVLLAIPLFRIVSFQVMVLQSEIPQISPQVSGFQTSPLIGVKRPDIYYIILDAYGREDVLREYYGFDNENFVSFLKEKDFFVANKSRSNYSLTNLSLASSLNMTLLDPLLESKDDLKSYHLPLLSMVDNSSVITFLKSIGYTYVHFRSDAVITESINSADVSVEPKTPVASVFGKMILDSTALSVFDLKYFKDTLRKRTLILDAFEQLEDIPKIKGPTFTLVHLLIPHEPYVFDRNGKIPRHTLDNKAKYIEQLVFANKKLEHLLETIFERSETSPVIILQGDHGPEGFGACAYPDQVFLRERMSIFNAYHFPGSAGQKLYDYITPVNSFRLLLGQYFGVEIDLLEDKSFLSMCYVNLFRFVEVPEERKVLSTLVSGNPYGEEWLKNLKESTVRFPDLIEARRAIGIQYLAMKQYEKAKLEFLKAVESEGKNLQNYLYLGEVLEKNEEYEDALEVYKTAQKLFPDNYLLNYRLGSINIHFEKFESGISYLQKTLAVKPSQKVIYLMIARAFGLADKHNDSIKYFHEYLYRDFYNSAAHFELGLQYDAVNNGSSAIVQTIIAKQLAKRENLADTLKQADKNLSRYLDKYNFRLEEFKNVKISQSY